MKQVWFYDDKFRPVYFEGPFWAHALMWLADRCFSFGAWLMKAEKFLTEVK